MVLHKLKKNVKVKNVKKNYAHAKIQFQNWLAHFHQIIAYLLVNFPPFKIILSCLYFLGFFFFFFFCLFFPQQQNYSQGAYLIWA